MQRWQGNAFGAGELVHDRDGAGLGVQSHAQLKMQLLDAMLPRAGKYNTANFICLIRKTSMGMLFTVRPFPEENIQYHSPPSLFILQVIHKTDTIY